MSTKDQLHARSDTETTPAHAVPELLNDLYCSPNIVRVNEKGGACIAFGGEERCIQGFGGET